MQVYLETVLAREDHAKEVKLFTAWVRAPARALPPEIFRRLYGE